MFKASDRLLRVLPSATVDPRSIDRPTHIVALAPSECLCFVASRTEDRLLINALASLTSPSCSGELMVATSLSDLHVFGLSNRPLSRNAETKDFAQLTSHPVRG